MKPEAHPIALAWVGSSLFLGWAKKIKTTCRMLIKCYMPAIKYTVCYKLAVILRFQIIHDIFNGLFIKRAAGMI